MCARVRMCDVYVEVSGGLVSGVYDVYWYDVYWYDVYWYDVYWYDVLVWCVLV
jgi:hypothetical protein